MIRHNAIFINTDSFIDGVQLFYFIIHNHSNIRQGHIGGRTQFAPTISRVMKQFKGSITKQVGRPIWQKSFYDHGIRNQQDYDEIWEYIENNPLKYAIKRTSV